MYGLLIASIWGKVTANEYKGVFWDDKNVVQLVVVVVV